MSAVERGERAGRRLRLLVELSRAAAVVRGREAYCQRARELLASWERDFRFTDIVLLDRDTEREDLPIRDVARAGHARVLRQDGGDVWLRPLRAAHDEHACAVLVLGLGEGWDDEEQVLQLIASQLEQGLVEPRLAQERAQDAMTRRLFYQSPVAICLVGGPSHRYLLANDSYLEMVNKRDIIGRTITEVWPEIVGTPLLAVFDRVYQTGEAYVSDEFVTALDRDGDGVAEECYFRFNIVPTRDAAGRVDGWTCTAADISAQVRARLEAQHARAQAEQANRAKDEFLAMLGHELRNPLAPITIALYLMEKQGDDRFVTERTTIQRQIDHLVRLVDDLLDVSRVTSGKLRLSKRGLELSEVVAHAAELSNTLLSERGQRLSLHVPSRGLPIHGDFDRLTQVVTNLLTNASKYSSDGSELSIDAWAGSGRATLTVRDRGIGISAEILPRLFDLFVQERQALDRARGGLGLGLAIVRGIVGAHGGSVRAYSDGPGRGSAFVVELPLANDQELAVAPASPRALPAAPPRSCEPARILVVDDNRDAALTLAQVLRGLGQQVEVAFDGEAALRVASAFAPSLALLDIGLPALDGYTLAGRLRAQQPGRVRLVAVTGYGQASDRDRAFAAGFDAHVVKPLRIDAVEAILEDLAAEREYLV